MKKALLLLIVLAICVISVAGASDAGRVSHAVNPAGDSLTSLQGESSGESLVIKNEPYYIEINPDKPESKLPHPHNDGFILDVPENDDCANATAVNEVDSLPFTLVDATIDGGNLSTFPNVWFLYTATITDRVRISTKDLVRSRPINADVTVYEGTTCPEYVEIPDPVELVGGETIETAVAITDPLPIAIRGSVSESNDLDYIDCSCIMAVEDRGPDVVYSYTASADGEVNFALGAYYYAAALIIMDDEGNELACEIFTRYRNPDEGTYGPAIYNFPVEEGETYYLVVSAYVVYSYDLGFYTLRIYSPNETTLDRSYNFRGGYSYSIMDVVAGEQYLIEASGRTYDFDEFEGHTFILAIEQLAAPVNDDCENATDGGILEPYTVLEFTGDNRGATQDCGMVTRYGEVWIKFTTEDTLDVKLDFCGSADPETGEGYGCLATMFSNDYCPCYSDGWTYGELDESNMFYYCPELSFITYYYELSPGTYYYPLISQYWWETDYQINITGIERQDCSSDALFGQGPALTAAYIGDYYFSDFESAYACFDKFEDVEGPFNEVTWWGAYSTENGNGGCDPTESDTFQVIICDIHEDYSHMPGDTVGVYEVEASAIETGYLYLFGEQQRFTATLPENIELNEGWIMIRDHGDNSDDCYFAWQRSEESGDAIVYDALEDDWTRGDYSMAFCLSYSQVDVDEEPVELPVTFELLQNYPNPFNATTSIRFSLAKTDDVSLTVYDVGGRLIKTLHNGELNAGYHTVIWDGTNQSGETVSSGIYFYKLDTSAGTFNNRMVLLK